MGSFLQRRSVRLCFVAFRWVRLTIWLLVLLVVMAAGYLHWVGLPDFLKRPILRHLRERGFDAQFSSMRLGWGPSVMVENAFFQRSTNQAEPQLIAGRAVLGMTWVGLLRARVALKSLEVYDGKLQFPPAGQSNRALSFDNIHLEMMFISTNFVRLTNTLATFHGVRLDLNGELDHAEAVRGWTPLRPGRAKTSWQALLARMTDIIDQIHFAKTPRIELNVTADARDLNTARAHLSVLAPDVSTPWGEARQIHLDARASRLLSTNEPILHVLLSADEAATRWAQGSVISLTASSSKDDQFNLQTTLKLSCDELDGSWTTNHLRSSGFRWNGAVGLDGTNFHLLRTEGNLRVARAESSWGSGRDLHVTLAAQAAEPPPDVTPQWGFWATLARYSFRWTVAGANITTPKLKLAAASLDGEWRAPLLQLSQLDATLYDGHLSGNASVDVATRAVIADAKASFDERRVAQLLTPAAQRWISQLDWQTPPNVSAELRMTLPAWTNRHPNWAIEVRPSLQIGGDFTAPNGGSFRGVPVDFAQSHFGYTNRVWTLPQLRAKKGGLALELSYEGSEETHDFHFTVDSALDPGAARPLLPPAQQHWFDEVKFSAPPKIQADIWGRWHSPELIGVRAQIDASNFIAHGESLDSFNATLDYTNRLLRATGLRLIKGTQYATVGLGEVDLDRRQVFVTNVLSAVSVDLIRRVTAPRTPKFLQLIQFDEAPAVRLSGSFRAGDPLATDLRFDVLGERFRFTNILADHISGGVQWRARNVLLTNIQAELYNTGALVGWCMFDYVPKHGTDFRCDFNAKDIDLHLLASGLTGRTNKLEGMLDGNLLITSANSTNLRSLNGHGHAHVHNALLWDIKLFGIFSPVLNAINPGSGESRAYDAVADYVITNGVVNTDDLVVHSTGFRLLYHGTLDLVTKQIDARAEAELLRDTRFLGPVLGALFSPLSKLFEYKINGDVHSPKKEPLFIPEPLMLLFRPFHTLKTMGESSPPAQSSAAPPDPATPKK